MKKKNLKSLNLKKATISKLNAETVSGGTVVITGVIRTILTEGESATTCSKFMACDSVIACPKTVQRTKMKPACTSA